MKNFFVSHHNLKKSLPVLLAVIFSFGAFSLLHPFRREVRVNIQVVLAHASSKPKTPFPYIDTVHLTPVQQKIVVIAKEQYAKKPVSYDANVLMYTQGEKEAWCADFASWLLNQAGASLRNPNSGYWRIPGVYTLQDYFKVQGRYKAVGTYIPKTGDVAIYAHGQGHAAIVLSSGSNGTITTVGGNERGRLRIDTRPQTGPNAYDLIGYGVIDTN